MTRERVSRPVAYPGFDVVRLAAALGVLASHAFPLRGDPEPVLAATGISFGFWCVAVFFAVSGCLVFQSWIADPDPRRFLARRLLRLVPALAVLLLASALVLGPAVTTLSVKAYFADPDTWGYLKAILLYPVKYGLPGVFLENPYPGAVNGSLWTLRLEFTMYLAVPAMAWLAARGGKAPVVAIWLLLLLADAVLAWRRVHLGIEPKGWLPQLPWFGAFFVAGLLVPMLPLRRAALAALAFAVVASACALAAGLPPVRYALALALPVAVIAAGRGLRLSLVRVGDLSYGTYLWAFPVQQVVMMLAPGLPLLLAMAVPAAVTLVLAWLSWWFVEHRALSYKPARPGAGAVAGGEAQVLVNPP
jgi:peptidoglycan/LPS O-acetylase OafA/YrhL